MVLPQVLLMSPWSCGNAVLVIKHCLHLKKKNLPTQDIGIKVENWREKSLHNIKPWTCLFSLVFDLPPWGISSYPFRAQDYKPQCHLPVSWSILTLNVNGLNSPTRRLRVDGWIRKKKDPAICCLKENQFSFKETHRLKVKG